MVWKAEQFIRRIRALGDLAPNDVVVIRNNLRLIPLECLWPIKPLIYD